MLIVHRPGNGKDPVSQTSLITFTDEDYTLRMITPHEDALVISAQVGAMDLRQILVDNRSSVEILYGHDESKNKRNKRVYQINS